MIKRLLHKLRIRLGLYDLRTEGEMWVKKNLGEEYVSDFLDKYDKINSGIPIGGIFDTLVFLDMVETIKKDI